MRHRHTNKEDPGERSSSSGRQTAKVEVRTVDLQVKAKRERLEQTRRALAWGAAVKGVGMKMKQVCSKRNTTKG
jgi:hypothetical protein